MKNLLFLILLFVFVTACNQDNDLTVQSSVDPFDVTDAEWILKPFSNNAEKISITLKVGNDILLEHDYFTATGPLELNASEGDNFALLADDGDTHGVGFTLYKRNLSDTGYEMHEDGHSASYYISYHYSD